MERNHAGDDAAREQAQAVPGHQASDGPVGTQGPEHVIRLHKALTKAKAKAKAVQSRQVPEKGNSVVHLQRSAKHQQAFNGALLWNAAMENNEGLVETILGKEAKPEQNPGTGSKSAKDRRKTINFGTIVTSMSRMRTICEEYY